MKNKLKLSFSGRIFASFVLCSFCVIVLWQNLGTLIGTFIEPSAVEEVLNAHEWILFFIALLIFALGAFAFYRLIARIIKAESERRIKEQNLIYAAIAHDLKTPMTSVQGYAAALRDGKIPPEKQAEAMKIIYTKSRRMNELVDSLFEYARLGTEAYQIKKESVDVAQIVREIAAENYGDFEHRGIELEADIPEQPLQILGDAQEFRRAVTNLIVNAWKHNEPGTQVRIAVKEENGRALISVSDTGASIPREERESLFQPFVTADKARSSSGGNGLGLAIAATVIARHGGEIKIAEGDAPYTKAFEIVGLSLCR